MPCPKSATIAELSAAYGSPFPTIDARRQHLATALHVKASAIPDEIASRDLWTLTTAELATIPGVGPKLLDQLIALHHLLNAPPPTLPILNTAEAVVNFIAHRYPNTEQEHLVLVLLDTHLGVITHEKLFMGQRGRIHVDNALLLRRVLLSGAPAFLLLHNHPSGNIRPSLEDIEYTRSLRSVAKLHNLTLVDHIVYASRTRFESIKAHVPPEEWN